MVHNWYLGKNSWTTHINITANLSQVVNKNSFNIILLICLILHQVHQISIPGFKATCFTVIINLKEQFLTNILRTHMNVNEFSKLQDFIFLKTDSQQWLKYFWNWMTTKILGSLILDALGF